MQSHKEKILVSIDFCLIPIGTDVSLAPFIATCQRIIKKAGLKHELGPNGTAIEGEWDEVFSCVRECHKEVHKLGAPRIYTSLKINTRTDKTQSFAEKVQSVIDIQEKIRD